MICTERPGFGASSRLPGRGFDEHADDLSAILDHLGIERPPAIAGSGGAPHLLAFAARHPERVAAGTIVVGAAPLFEAEVEQQIPLNVEAYRFVMANDFAGALERANEVREENLTDPLASIRSIMSSAPATDLAMMDDPDWQAAYIASAREMLRLGAEGWVDEGFAIFGRYAEIDLDVIGTSITWWHGDGDRNVPLSAARRVVSRLPAATLIEWKAEGHMAAYHREGELLDELLLRSDAA
jgi:pimeloyl-ACP methyl ester carboxylesterase